MLRQPLRASMIAVARPAGPAPTIAVLDGALGMGSLRIGEGLIFEPGNGFSKVNFIRGGGGAVEISFTEPLSLMVLIMIGR